MSPRTPAFERSTTYGNFTGPVNAKTSPGPKAPVGGVDRRSPGTPIRLMMRALPTSTRAPRGAAATLCVVAAWLTACGGGPSAGTPPSPASEAEWRGLASPRPTPLPSAPRISLAEVELLAQPTWPSGASIAARLGVTELVVAGLLRRADVRFVERRRFGAAAEAERTGAARPAGAPAVGVSPGAEITVGVTRVPLGPAGTSLEVRLTETATGRVVGTRRTTVPAAADPVGLARSAVATILGALDDLGRLPAWNDPIPGAAPSQYAPSGVPAGALASFLDGLASEERWRWEGARVGYQAAARAAGFFEAEAALARTARLRLGGTLGES